MRFLKIVGLLFCIIYFEGGCSSARKQGGQPVRNQYSGNPVIPGDFADPCILINNDSFYIYATTGAEATVWRSADFVNWKLTKLNWPTSMRLPDIWAPSVRKGADGRFYLYTSTDHNIYAGVADRPTGPFTNILGGKTIFIKNRQWWNKIHSIDADCFIDDDGQAYLYWGSGFDFKDGVCAVGKLGKDMASFVEPPREITPTGYFEGPHMMKRNGKYYLMYSDGFYYDSTYKVRYAVSDSPMGPFVEGKNSPILSSTPDGKINGPGHHYTFHVGDDYYIVYHRHTQPFDEPLVHGMREVCIDKLEFEVDGSIEKVVATQKGVPLDFVKHKTVRKLLKPVAVASSSSVGPDFEAAKAFDGSYGTMWAADRKNLPAWINADFGKAVIINSCELAFAQIMGDYKYKIEYSLNGLTWNIYASGNNASAEEWPVEHVKYVRARYLRITILPQTQPQRRVGFWEINIR